MDKLLDKVNCIGGGCVAVLTAIFGPMWIFFAGFFVLNVADWLTGWRWASKNGKSDSKVGARGIAKKVGYWLIIAVSFYIGFAFEKLGQVIGVPLAFMNYIGWFVLANYLVNEIRSLIENLVKLGVGVPKFLTKGLKIAGDLIDNAADGKLPKGEKDKN